MSKSIVGAFAGLVCIVAMIAVATVVGGNASSRLAQVSDAEACQIWGGGAGWSVAGDGCEGTVLGCQTLSGVHGSGTGNQTGTAFTSCGGSCGNVCTAHQDTE